ncbi:MAG: helix-turn-helix domain-containing protein [Thermoanaerobaculia bacterium]
MATHGKAKKKRTGKSLPPSYLRSPCPIASTLDLVGDRWTLLVIRDLLLTEKRRFAELLASPERISTNLLAERLERLEAAGLVERRLYQKHPPRYEVHLTEKGRDLAPVLRELGLWGNRHLPGTFRPTPAMEEKLRGSKQGTS